MGLLSSIERRVVAEANLSNPSTMLLDSVGGRKSAAGVRVSPDTALRSSPVFACVNVLSKDVAQIPLILYERTDEGRRRAFDHSVYARLHDEPNPRQTPATFKQMLQAHALMWGGAFAEIEYDERMNPVALWPLLPDRTKAVLVDGEKFIATRVNGKNVGIPAWRVLHLPGLGFDGLNGYNIVELAKEAIGLGLAAEEFEARFFSNGSRLTGVLNHPKKLSKDAHDRLRDDFEMMHRGLENAHRMAILEEGMTWTATGVKPEEAQMIESLKFNVEAVARFFDVPLVRLHQTEKTTSWGTGVEQFMLGYVKHSLGFWLTLWEEAVSQALLKPGERRRYYAEFLRAALLQGDSKARGEFYKELFAVGALSPNDIRELENMNRRPGLDRYFIPSNTAEVTEGGVVPASTSTGSGARAEPAPAPRALPAGDLQPAAGAPWAALRRRTEQAHAEALRAVAVRVLGAEARALRRAVHKANGAADAASLWGWAGEYADTRESEWMEALTPPALALAGSLDAAVSALAGGDGTVQRGEVLEAVRVAAASQRLRVHSAVTAALSAEPERHAELLEAAARRWEAEEANRVASSVVAIIGELVTERAGFAAPPEGDTAC